RDRDLVDPALLAIDGNFAGAPGPIGRHHLAVIAAGHESLPVAGSGQDSAAMDCHATRLTVPADQPHRFFAEHEGGSVLEKMRAKDRAVRRNRARARGKRRDVVAGIGHRAISLFPPFRGGMAPSESEEPGGVPVAPPGRLPAATLPSGEGYSRLAGRKAAPDFFFGKIAADEHDAALALFVRFPGPLVVSIEDHVDPLENETLRVAVERENALAAQDARAIFCHEILDPRKELVGIER